MQTFEEARPSLNEHLVRIVEALRKCWHEPKNTQGSQTLMVEAHEQGKVLRLKVAPVWQEVVGGESDGSLSWVPFTLDYTQFLSETSGFFRVRNVGIGSFQQSENKPPRFFFEGEVGDREVRVTLLLEPNRDDRPAEAVDTIRRTVRPLQRQGA